MHRNLESDSARITRLRTRAEELLRSANHAATPLEGESLEQVLHELEVSRAELEIQNQELREAQASLQAALHAQTELFDSSPVAYLLLDSNGVILRANRKAASMLGLERRSLCGRPLVVFLPAQAHEPALRQRLAALNSEQPVAPIEVPLLPRVGGQLWVRMDSARHSQANDTLVCLTSLVDITARKTAELQLEESERRHRTLVDSLPDISYIYSLQRGGIFYSRQVGEVLGYSPEHLLAHPNLWHDSIHRDDLPAVDRAIQASKRGRPVDVRYRIRDAAGEWRWLHDRSVEIATPEGEVHIHGVARDVSERMRIEEELRLSEERLSLALLGAHDGLWDWDMETDEVYYSPRWKSMLGYEEHEVANRFSEWERLVNPEDRRRAREILDRYIAGETDRFEIELRMRHKDGHWVDILSRAFLLRRDADGKPMRVVGTHEDISDRKAKEALLSARARLAESATGSSQTDLMQKFLDEAELLTESQIGFFHFIEGDQKTLSLQTWSTNTLERMCTAAGGGSHYPIDKAGVWIDAVRQRQPVIHNDYASLPHRKGMPEGHAPVIRELVVPVFRDEKIVAVLGVGNKPRDYNEDDVFKVSRLAETAWDLVTRRRLEDELTAANRELREKNVELERALDEIKTLRGIIPICSNCKSIRDDKGLWKQLEAYVASHSHAEFTHSICPDCLKELYPEYVEALLNART